MDRLDDCRAWTTLAFRESDTWGPYKLLHEMGEGMSAQAHQKAGADPHIHGTRLVAISPPTVEWAVDELVKLDPGISSSFKIRSGEHLAAILMTAFVFATPVSVDTDGGVDLVFVTRSERNLPNVVQAGERIAVEVKSMPGSYRKFDSRAENLGQAALGEGFEVRFESADDILRQAQPLIERMAINLASVEAHRRYGFLVVHPFDKLAVELAKEPLIASVLSPLELPNGLDGLWVLWVPDQLATWSVEERCWYQMFFSASGIEEAPQSGEVLEFLQEIETRFLAGIHWPGGSPYLFSLTAEEDVGHD